LFNRSSCFPFGFDEHSSIKLFVCQGGVWKIVEIEKQKISILAFLGPQVKEENLIFALCNAILFIFKKLKLTEIRKNNLQLAF